MKTAVTIVILLITLAGCSAIERAIPEMLPTARYCDEVLYQRSGDAVTFAASCKAPFGGM